MVICFLFHLISVSWLAWSLFIIDVPSKRMSQTNGWCFIYVKGKILGKSIGRLNWGLWKTVSLINIENLFRLYLPQAWKRKKTKQKLGHNLSKWTVKKGASNTCLKWITTIQRDLCEKYILLCLTLVLEIFMLVDKCPKYLSCSQEMVWYRFSLDLIRGPIINASYFT